uniref:Uncharacterized protein n=1 Tax=Arundo donax TaxID=35708 RepID=A0A0A9CG24_ARUDO
MIILEIGSFLGCYFPLLGSYFTRNQGCYRFKRTRWCVELFLNLTISCRSNPRHPSDYDYPTTHFIVERGMACLSNCIWHLYIIEYEQELLVVQTFHQ